MSRCAVLLGLGIAVVGCGRFGFSTTNGGGGGGSPDSGTVDGVTPISDSGELMTASCTGLAPTCGPGQNASCCGSPMVPAGSYKRSYDMASDGMYPSTMYSGTVDDFRLDQYEVTVGRFRKFVEAGMGTQASPPLPAAGAHPQIGGTGWSSAWDANLVVDTPALISGIKCSGQFQTWTDTAGANENKAMNCITWYEAFAFCAWDGGFLPTENEWNYAAAGGSDQRAYPWSSPSSSIGIDCNSANYDPSAGSYCVAPNGGVLPVGSTSPQGDGPFGQADLAGNLWEKTLDTYAGAQYTSMTCDNCVDLSTPSARVVRGGAWNADENSARTGYRYFDPPTDRYIEMGVRCARVP
ncbi:MAG TPA: SUMF1/EgtB/PvdO family nonheme iron enzyme [Kofleriaceae bacterium]|nr:SUMF1/EgtB/PvdO family nonheme iron enzyme [Kofleriaceae bacterium]